jgi:hypothetical protein
VGREAIVADVTTKLMSNTSSRILIYGINHFRHTVVSSNNLTCFSSSNIGIAGVGKDTVAAAVVNEPQVRNAVGVLQGWIQASSKTVMQQQLKGLFVTHRPWVVRGVQDDLVKCLAAIKEWLAKSDDWILVFEDASPASASLWDVLPKDTGRVLVTSQAPLHGTHKEFTGVQLDELSTSDSLNLLLKGDIFSKKPVNAAEPLQDDAALLARCAEAGVDFTASAVNESTEQSIERRQSLTDLVEEAVLRARCRELGVAFVSAPTDGGAVETAAKASKRRRNMTEVLRQDFVDFLETVLGNKEGQLPLSVNIVKEIMITNPGINNTLDLIDDFKTVKLGEVWENAARNSNDRHYYGLAMSVKINLDRMDNDESIPLEQRREAKALLCAMSRLDRTKVPLSLLTGHEMEDLVNRECPEGKFILKYFICDQQHSLSPLRNFPFNPSVIATKNHSRIMVEMLNYASLISRHLVGMYPNVFNRLDARCPAAMYPFVFEKLKVDRKCCCGEGWWW